MCCAVQMPRLERFLSVEPEEINGPEFPELGWTPARVIRVRPAVNDRPESPTTADGNGKVDVNDNVIEKAMDTTAPESEEKGAAKKKKKKWRPISLVDTGFNTSLFPRPAVPGAIDPEEEERILCEIERDLFNYDITLCKYEQFNTDTSVVQFECKTKGKRKYLRADRDRKIMKAGRQVKSKNCRSLRNNNGRKKLHIHHRLYKLIDLEVKRVSCHLPSPKPTYHNDINNKSTDSSKSRLKTAPYASNNNKPAPVQNLAHALHRSNASTEFDRATTNILVDIQHRELTPEDYELLLRLDERVAPKTLDKATLSSFRTDLVTEATAGDICAVCMDAYEIGQNRKFLPCDHVFHTKCIDMWLENSSRNCPIDGLPIDQS